MELNIEEVLERIKYTVGDLMVRNILLSKQVEVLQENAVEIVDLPLEKEDAVSSDKLAT